MLKKLLISIPIIILSLMSPVALSLGGGLNTKKIDANIERLLKQSWFEEIYLGEHFRHLFFANKNVRKKLNSNLYVNRLIHNKRFQHSFLLILEKENAKGVEKRKGA